MSKIKSIKAHEIKDSRGNPTVEVELTTSKGSFIASCPSGVSTGQGEALELRDEDGRGASKAIENVNAVIAKKLKNQDPREQKKIDELMVALDGTDNKSRLGANAILPVSIVVCRAGATAKKVPLYQHISEIGNWKLGIGNPKVPLPSFNFIEGGAHAANDLALQEFMVMPQRKSFAENLALGNKVFLRLKELIGKTYGEVSMGDEGGFAPNISKAEQALFLLKNVIGNRDARIAIDAAASEFFHDGKYLLEGKEFSREALVQWYQDLASRFNIISIEDPFSEEDFEGFREVKKALPHVVIIGDDLTTTNIKRIKDTKSKDACNGVIIKPNQIGTVSEAIEAALLAKSYGWKVMASHRAGETFDTFIADFAVGVGADFIKSGSPSQAERMVKYNRLLEIESELFKDRK